MSQDFTSKLIKVCGSRSGPQTIFQTSVKYFSLLLCRDVLIWLCFLLIWLFFCGFFCGEEGGCARKLRDLGAAILQWADIILAVSSFQYPLKVNTFLDLHLNFNLSWPYLRIIKRLEHLTNMNAISLIFITLGKSHECKKKKKKNPYISFFWDRPSVEIT